MPTSFAHPAQNRDVSANVLASVFSGTRSGRAAVENVTLLSDDPLARTLWRRFDTQGARKATFNTSLAQARMYKVLGASPADSESTFIIVKSQLIKQPPQSVPPLNC